MNITGVTVSVNGKYYGMHEACADNLIEQLVQAGYSVLDDNMPARIVQPIIEDTNWNCAHSECTHA